MGVYVCARVSVRKVRRYYHFAVNLFVKNCLKSTCVNVPTCVCHCVRTCSFVYARVIVSLRTVQSYYSLSGNSTCDRLVSLTKQPRYKLLDECASSKPTYAYFAKASTQTVVTPPDNLAQRTPVTFCEDTKA